MGFEKFHDKYYKHLLLIPLFLMVFSLIYLGAFYYNTGDFFRKDITLSGGTSATLNGGDFDIPKLKEDLSSRLEEVNIKSIYDMISMERKAIIIETKTDAEHVKEILEEYLGYELDESKASFEYTDSSLSDSFYKQLLVAILFAFVLMSIVVFIQFKNVISSGTIVFAAFADIVMALTAINLMGMTLSNAGITAFLMLIGYAVDSNILLTTRFLKGKSGSENQRLYESFKTGMAMALTTMLAISFALAVVYSFSAVLSQIFIVLLFGLLFDQINTWITNVSILKWNAHRGEKK